MQTRRLLKTLEVQQSPAWLKVAPASPIRWTRFKHEVETNA